MKVKSISHIISYLALVSLILIFPFIITYNTFFYEYEGNYGELEIIEPFWGRYIVSKRS